MDFCPAIHSSFRSSCGPRNIFACFERGTLADTCDKFKTIPDATHLQLISQVNNVRPLPLLSFTGSKVCVCV